MSGARMRGGALASSRPRALVGGRSSSREQVSEVQRSRLFGAAVAVMDELGYPDTSVAHITARARMSRRTFYELFENREACFVELLDHVAGMVESELAHAGLDGLSWRERVRGGLRTVLCYFDREPALARVCVVQALRGGPSVLARREEILSRLARVLDQGRRVEGTRARATTRGPVVLTAEGLVGAAFSIVYARLLRGERAPLSGLLNELMGMIVLPYLGPGAARREQTFSSGRYGPAGVKSSARLAWDVSDPLAGLPMRLTYRTARVLECVAERPGASNRVLAEQAGIADQGQISKLLARLERLGLVVNSGEGHARGEPNAWTLTPTGLRVAQGISAYTSKREGVSS